MKLMQAHPAHPSFAFRHPWLWLAVELGVYVAGVGVLLYLLLVWVPA